MCCIKSDALVDISNLSELNAIPRIIESVKSLSHTISTIYFNVPHRIACMKNQKLLVNGPDPFNTLVDCVQRIYHHVQPLCEDSNTDVIVLIPSSSYQHIDVGLLFLVNEDGDRSHLPRLFPQTQVHTIRIAEDGSHGMDDEHGEYRELVPFSCGCVGGTFDHFHVGHKVLMTACMAVVKDRLIVGIADGPLLANKSYPQFIQSLEAREKKLKKFCTQLSCTAQIETCIIRDPHGPAASNPDLQVCVVSEETVKGLESLNRARVSNQLPPLDSRVVKLVSPSRDSGNCFQTTENVKYSSTEYRRKMAKQTRHGI